MKNIFNELKILEKQMDQYSGSLQKLLLSLRYYIDSLRWVRSDIEMKIYNYLQEGYTTDRIAEILDINPSSLRSSISRMSGRIRQAVFDGIHPSKEITSLDAGEINAVFSNIKIILGGEFRYTDLFYANVYSEMREHIHEMNMRNMSMTEKGSDDIDLYSDDIVRAVRFVVKYSKDLFINEMEDINPEALQTVLDGLPYDKGLKEEYLAVKELFLEQQYRISSVNALGNKIIHSIKLKSKEMFEIND